MARTKKRLPTPIFTTLFFCRPCFHSRYDNFFPPISILRLLASLASIPKQIKNLEKKNRKYNKILYISSGKRVPDPAEDGN